MNSYKRAIEEIVHPLIAPEPSKNTLRRELWAHFSALVDESVESGMPEPDACDRALARLGTPEEIRGEFMEAMPRIERWAARLDRRCEETSNHYALRMLRTFFPLLALAAACFGLQVTVIKPNHGALPIMIMLTLGLWVTLYLYSALRQVPGWQGRLRKNDSVAPFLRAFFVHACFALVLAFACVLLGLTGLAVIMGSHDATTLSYLYMGSILMTFEWLTLTAVLCYVLIRERQGAQTIPDWPYKT